MREIIFDTETTGLDHRQDRIIEIGAIELENRFPCGRTFHVYINPQGRQVHPDAFGVHGISNSDLDDKPIFSAIADEFLRFIDGAQLVAHNANFDMNFVNSELSRLGLVSISPDRVVDTLSIARRKHPGGQNSLDALCRRYGIDNTHRTLHGALLDCELLAEVYIELMGGRQAALGLEIVTATSRDQPTNPVLKSRPVRPSPLPQRLSDLECSAHKTLVDSLGDNSPWARLLSRLES